MKLSASESDGWVTEASDGFEEIELFDCPICFAMTREFVLHEEWHEENDLFVITYRKNN